MGKAEDQTRAAAEWRFAHPDDWDFLVAEAWREARYRGWASIHNAADRTRMDRNVRIPNVIKPALARFLVMEEPGLAKYVKLNKAAADTVDIECIYEEVGGSYEA